jgi:hypothetical protein
MLRGISKEQQAELRDLIEAVRKAGFAEGYAAAKMEAVMATKEAEDTPIPARGVPKAAADTDDEYISRTPLNTTKALALEYLADVQRAAGPTEIIRNTLRKSGTRLTHTTLRRALDALVDEGRLEIVDNSRWIIKEVNRAVPLRPVR